MIDVKILEILPDFVKHSKFQDPAYTSIKQSLTINQFVKKAFREMSRSFDSKFVLR